MFVTKALSFWREERSHKSSDAGIMRSYVLMFANYYGSKFAWRLTFSLDLFSCYLNSIAQHRLPDFTASTRLSDMFKMADAADDGTVTRCSKRQEYPIEDVDTLAFLQIMTSARSLGSCRIKTWRITSRILGLPGIPSPKVHVYRYLRVRNASQEVGVWWPLSYQREVSDSVVTIIVRVQAYELCLTQSLGL